jgi:hypothetical protein
MLAHIQTFSDAAVVIAIAAISACSGILVMVARFINR